MSDIYKQKIALKIGAEGCYYLSLLRVAEIHKGMNFDAIELYSRFRKSFELQENGVNQVWLGEDCYVYKPENILKDLTHSFIVYVNKVYDLTYEPRLNEYLIGLYEWKKDSETTYYHFVLLNNDKQVIWDPLETSNTVKYGKLVSLRVIGLSK